MKIFNLNYDPLIERAAEIAKVRVVGGFYGMGHAYFESALFEERIGRIRGSFKSKLFDETAKPIQLFELHGSVGWYDCPLNGTVAALTIRHCQVVQRD